jgi:hypothetical protein
MTLPPPWDEYLRVQQVLDDTTEINNRSWALEAALDAVVARAPTAAGTLPVPVTASTLPVPIKTVMATAARRERYRAALRRELAIKLEPMPFGSPGSMEARVQLQQLRPNIAAWNLLTGLAFGRDYDELAGMFGTTPGALRVRALRLRQSLIRFAA